MCSMLDTHLRVVRAPALAVELPAVVRAHDVALATDVAIAQRCKPVAPEQECISMLRSTSWTVQIDSWRSERQRY